MPAMMYFIETKAFNYTLDSILFHQCPEIYSHVVISSAMNIIWNTPAWDGYMVEPVYIGQTWPPG